MRYLLNTTEIYRVATVEEATEIIDEAKRDGNYILSKYSSVKREQKAKGEVIDEWYKVTLVKSFNEEKEPAYTVDVIYEV